MKKKILKYIYIYINQEEEFVSEIITVESVKK